MTRLTVGITTRDRPDSLKRCLASLAHVAHLDPDVIVFDDASRTPVSRQLEGVQRAPFRIIRDDGRARLNDPLPRLKAAFGDLGWVLPETLAAAPGPEDIYYDVVAQVEMTHWRSQRTVLVGDAAYAVSLLAGQGASLALAGGRALGQVLDGEADIAAALARFEQRLRSLVGKAARRAAHGQMVRAGQPAPRRHPRHVSQHHDLAAAIGPAESFLLVQLQGLFTGFPLTL